MNTSTTTEMSNYRPLRIWIPVLLVLLMGLSRFFVVGLPEVPMGWMVVSFVPALGGIFILLWWMTVSRATWKERLAGLLGVMAAITVAAFLMDKTMLGPPITVLTLPTTVAAFAVVLIVMSHRLSFRRTQLAVLVAFLVAGFSALLKNDGATGDFNFGFDWRWRPTPEEIFLASRSRSGPMETPRRVPEAFSNPAWPGFRGPNRDGIQRGAVFASNWDVTPPKEMWRIRLGPAWSSFAVADYFLVTQEQRGEHEAIVCYDVDTGREIWAQEIESRFFDALGGLGTARHTLIADSSVYALGAEGLLVKLNALDGSLCVEERRAS